MPTVISTILLLLIPMNLVSSIHSVLMILGKLLLQISQSEKQTWWEPLVVLLVLHVVVMSSSFLDPASSWIQPPGPKPEAKLFKHQDQCHCCGFIPNTTSTASKTRNCNVSGDGRCNGEISCNFFLSPGKAQRILASIFSLISLNTLPFFQVKFLKHHTVSLCLWTMG